MTLFEISKAAAKRIRERGIRGIAQVASVEDEMFREGNGARCRRASTRKVGIEDLYTKRGVIRRGIRGWLLEVFWFLELLVYCLTFRCLGEGPRKFGCWLSLPIRLQRKVQRKLTPVTSISRRRRHQETSSIFEILLNELIRRRNVWRFFGVKADIDYGNTVKFEDSRRNEEKFNRLTILSTRWTCISCPWSCSEILLD